ncbi:phytochelatin synthase family protein [Nodosilinea sp. FACHB-141]|nr:phytochelatin synthase family protein [Nodosilinea sp. FACHB-13]MBD2114344.1 phytochelatin synthase family protein [Nodosilinea sp. FACHB-141]
MALLTALGVTLIARPLASQTLPLPDHLVPLTSAEGQMLLRDSEALADYVPLTSQFVTQVNQAFCGVASTVMVLNALGVPAPLAPEWERNYFTQENVFNEQTEAIIAKDAIARQGLTLSELEGILETYPVQAETHHGGDVSLEEFRSLIRTNLETSNSYVLINYLRRAIGQESGGHISPVAAYDADTDQFLILDVSRYKYPPVWVQAERLWQSTNTVDSVSGKTRGFLLVQAR